MLRLVAILKLVWTWADPYAGVEMVVELAMSADNPQSPPLPTPILWLCSCSSFYVEHPATFLHPDNYSSFQTPDLCVLQGIFPELQAGEVSHL